MNKATRILLSIIVPLLLNIIFIVFTIRRFSACENSLYHYECLLKNTYLYLIWIVIEIVIIAYVFIKTKNKKQLIALPIISLLFMALLLSWSAKLINYQPRKFNKENWNNKNHFFRSNCVEDLIKNELLKDKCYEEIIQTLGKPDNESNTTLEYDFGFGFIVIQLSGNCYKSINGKCEGKL